MEVFMKEHRYLDLTLKKFLHNNADHLSVSVLYVSIDFKNSKFNGSYESKVF